MRFVATIAPRDYMDRRRRQQQGIEKLKAEVGYKGRKEDMQRDEVIMTMLRKDDSWNHFIAATGCLRSTLPAYLSDSKPRKAYSWASDGFSSVVYRLPRNQRSP